MKITRKIISIFVAFVTLFCISGVALGSVVSLRLTGDYVTQAKSNWCWAASAENTIKHDQIIHAIFVTRTQWDAVSYIKGTKTTPYPNVSGSIYNSCTAAEYISGYTEDYTASQSSYSFSFLRQKINNGHCVIVAAGYYSSGTRNGGHATLLTGWSTANDSQTITYYDSYTGTTLTCTYTAFCDGSFNGRKYDQTCYHS